MYPAAFSVPDGACEVEMGSALARFRAVFPFSKAFFRSTSCLDSFFRIISHREHFFHQIIRRELQPILILQKFDFQVQFGPANGLHFHYCSWGIYEITKIRAKTKNFENERTYTLLGIILQYTFLPPYKSLGEISPISQIKLYF